MTSFDPKELIGCYVIILKNNKIARISNVLPDLSKIFVPLENCPTPLSYSLPTDLETKIRFADAELHNVNI